MKKGERTAQSILDAAEQLFADKGYEESNLREIADTVGIQEPGLYRHFKNKEAIYQAVLERALLPLEVLLKQKIETGIDQKSLHHLPAEVFDIFIEHPSIAILFQRAVLADPKEETAMQLWLNNLLRQAKVLIQQMPERNVAKGWGEEIIVLRIVALFNLCVGYFSSQAILNQFIDEADQDEELTEKYKTLLTDLMGSWLN